MQIRFIYKWAGRFNLLPVIFVLCFSPGAAALDPDFHIVRPLHLDNHRDEWQTYNLRMQKQEDKDRINGISYIISGALALAGGLAGQGLTSDPLERGVYTIFQTMGVASIGYGIYTWKLGDEDRAFYEALASASGLNNSERVAVMRSYLHTKELRKRQERFVLALTHSLIAALNFYGATQQKNDSLKNALFFIGGVNTLAAVSYSF